MVASLKAELEAQRALGQQSRALQKQLKERDAEVAQLKTKSEEATTQLSSAQSEVKALQTKLAAARSTAASLESAATRVPGSAIKNNGGNRANAAASAEAAHAAQFAQLKEDLYSDLTGLIVRDVKKREDDYLYDCIQTGINGSKFSSTSCPRLHLIQWQLYTSNWLFPMFHPPISKQQNFNTFRSWMRTEIVTWSRSCLIISRWT